MKIQRLSRWLSLTTLLVLVSLLPVRADVTNPAAVTGLEGSETGADVTLSWIEVDADVTGNGEITSHYKIYRGDAPDFVPDKDFDSNLAGTSTLPPFVDLGAAGDGIDHYYLVSAVDTSGNEGITRASKVTTPPVLSGFWTDTTIELDWTGVQPLSKVQGYRVYYGRVSGVWEFVDDLGLVNSHTLSGLDTLVNWYILVTAIDLAGNESDPSNEHIDAVGGVVEVQAHNEAFLCWVASGCPPKGNEIQRSSGQEIMVPVDFPEGEWVGVTLEFIAHARLWDNPNAPWNAPDKCGSTNPSTDGWNPGGDPWDRTAHVFLVEDDCIAGGGGCVGRNDNVELLRTITPFGTDDDPPQGSGVVPQRVWQYDITPLTPILVGKNRHVGVHISTFVRSGWRTWVKFRFSERPEDTSPKPPADGITQVIFNNGGEVLTPRTVTVPPEAVEVMGRFFITGHGGNQACDGGTNDGGSCDPGCPGGSCQNCDEFCHREQRIMADGAQAWSVVPWRDDCTPGGILDCTNWNACGWPSCTFSRAGWCPGYIACHHDDPCDQDIDLTNKLTPGGTHNVTWEIPVRNGSWSKSMLVYWYNTSTAFCGNGVREGLELCDGADLGGETCQGQGFDGGTLVCNASCDGVDTSGCRFFTCGNTICEPAGGEDCLSCAADCNGVQGGNPGNRFCCGDGDGENPVSCADPRCTDLGNTCE